MFGLLGWDTNRQLGEIKMSKTEKTKIIIDDKEYSGDEITPDILLGAIQSLKINFMDDMDKRFKAMATKMNKLNGHIDLIDGAVQEHETSIQGFNQNFAKLQEMMNQPQVLPEPPKGENVDKNEKE